MKNKKLNKIKKHTFNLIMFYIIVFGSLYYCLNPYLYPSNFKPYVKGEYDCKHFSIALSERVEAEYPEKEVWIMSGRCYLYGDGDFNNHAWVNIDGVDYEAVIVTRKMLWLENCVSTKRISPNDFKIFLSLSEGWEDVKWETVNENGEFE